jgi:hypothetical protein
VIAGDDQRAVHARSCEAHRVPVLAFDDRALHVEALLDLLGPLPGDLACLGQAELVLTVYADVRHGLPPLSIELP